MQKMEMRKTLLAYRDEESILGSTVDPFVLCISKGQARDGTMCNRMLMCLLAVAMLWGSSFTVAVYVANRTISSPTLRAVFASCGAAFDLMSTQADDYDACVDRQLAACNRAFHKALRAEVAASNAALAANAAALAEYSTYEQECSNSYTTAKVPPCPPSSHFFFPLFRTAGELTSTIQ